MKKLYLVRHAKSSWELPGIPDVDRPLNGRGVRDAYSSSEWLREMGYLPDLMVSSPATRALHTAMIFARTFDVKFSNILIKRKLYEADHKQLLSVIQTISDDYQSIMVFAHNPGITHFVNHAIDHHIDNVPTTGIACLNYEVSQWQQIGNKAELVFFDYPKKRRNQ